MQVSLHQLRRQQLQQYTRLFAVSSFIKNWISNSFSEHLEMLVIQQEQQW